jgi:long-chain acyl-CoA synthetase
MNWREAERDYDDEVIGDSTLARMFEDAAERHADRPAQWYKGGVYDRSLAPDVLDPAPDGEYGSLSYAEMRHVVRRLAAGFRDLGVAADDRVAIFSSTRMEWAHCDFALLAAGAVVTTVYKGSAEPQVRHLLDDPGATAVVVEDDGALDRVLAVEDDLDLSFVVAIDDVDDRGRDDVHALDEVYQRGTETFDRDAYESWVDDREPGDLASLIYTSGTTGRPKGVQLTHWNFRSNVNQVRKRFGPRPDKDVPAMDETSRTISYLPLAHVFERLSGHFFLFASGATVAYAESPDTLREDFQLVQPTSGTSVPRVYEKLYDAIREQAESSPVKARIFRWATGVGREYFEADDPGPVLRAKRAVADRLVFEQVREALGGEVEFLFSGGGSLSPDLCALFHGMGLPILEGYGLTETSPVVTTNPAEEPKVGTIGPAVPGVELDVDESVAAEEHRERAEGDVGELLVKGPNVTDGYWNLPDATDDAFTEDVPASSAERSSAEQSSGRSPREDDANGKSEEQGSSGRWFRTGDVVELRDDGYVEFMERAKQILTLSTGKNVAPGPLEDAFAASDVVEQAMVVGDGRKFVSAVVVPNLDAVRSWADDEDVDLPEDDWAACRDDRVRERVRAEVDRANEGFAEYERIKTFRLVPTEFTEDNDLLTPTMKKKRRNILDRFEDEIDAMYEP